MVEAADVTTVAVAAAVVDEAAVVDGGASGV